MSNTPCCTCSGIPIDRFSSLAGRLQETAEALLAFSFSMPHGAAPKPEQGSHVQDHLLPEQPAQGGYTTDQVFSETANKDEHAGGYTSATKTGEHRQYHLALHTLQKEGELLERYTARSLGGALYGIYNDFFVLVFLMKGYEGDGEMDSYHLSLIGEQLSRSLDMLGKACSVLADYDLVHAKRVPALA